MRGAGVVATWLLLMGVAAFLAGLALALGVGLGLTVGIGVGEALFAFS